MKQVGKNSEYKNFDASISKILSVSHEELQRREEKWKKERKRKKREKQSLWPE